MARLSAGDAEDYNLVKSSLLAKYRISAEEFRRRFRQDKKKPNESFVEFACGLSDNFTEWVKGSDADGDISKLKDLMCLERFYDTLPESMQVGVSMKKAAQLADEYVASRNIKEGRVSQDARQDQLRKGNFFPAPHNRFMEAKGQQGSSDAPKTVVKEPEDPPRNFDVRRPVMCYNCKQPGHFARNCRNERPAFACVSSHPNNHELLKPYTKEVTVNGQKCRVLRDSAATMDVVHPSYVRAEDYVSGCAWIRQAVSEDSVCLPTAKVKIEGPFGVLETIAAVSKGLPESYPYLFSNSSEALLNERMRLHRRASNGTDTI